MDATGTYDLYHYRDGDVERVREYRRPQRLDDGAASPTHVLFAEDGKAIVTGSNHGMVHVFDRATTQSVAELRHGQGTIHAITVSLFFPPIYIAVTKCVDGQGSSSTPHCICRPRS